MSVQVIERDGKPELAMIPYEVYRRLVEEGYYSGARRFWPE